MLGQKKIDATRKWGAGHFKAGLLLTCPFQLSIQFHKGAKGRFGLFPNPPYT